MKSYDELKALIEQRGTHAVFGPYGEGFGIEQNSWELANFLVVCQQLGVESVLEIGTGWRAGLARFLYDDMGWEVVSVDIHDYGHQYEGVTFEHSDGVELPVFSAKFDLVILDGDHSYDGVRFDYDYYGKYAAKIVAFHDIAGLRDCEGVADWWGEHAYYNASINDMPEPQLRHGWHEIIASGEQRGGIGYVVLSELGVQTDTPAKRAPVAKKAAAKKPTSRASTTKKPAAKKAVAKK